MKGIVERVRREKLKEKCEFCSMDIELEAVEKKEFNDVVNSFRAINVGNIFVEHCFLDFYRHHQEFITVCVECKDRKIYLEKKTIKNARGVASKLMLKWIIAARSNLLHHGINKWRIEGTDPTHRKKEHH